MRKPEAEYLIKRLIGWINPRIESVGYGDFIVTAIDPYDNQRKVYNPKSGFFIEQTPEASGHEPGASDNYTLQREGEGQC
jgi:hypothetical protein